MSSRTFKILAFGVAALFAAFYTAEGFLYRDYNVDMFQVATGYLKDRNGALYPTDFIWSKADMIRNLHVCVRELMRATDALTLGLIHEPIDLFLLWLPVGFLLFFWGNYLLAFRFTHDRWASLLVACSFMLVRRTPWDWWGMGPTYTMSARGLALCVLPLGLWAFLCAKENFCAWDVFFSCGDWSAISIRFRGGDLSRCWGSPSFLWSVFSPAPGPG